MGDGFTWQDGERTIRFGRGALATAGELLGDGYCLLTTSRAEAVAPDVVAAASAVHHVGPGPVDELAGDLRDRVSGTLLVALGGGRVVDVAKALAAAAGPPVRVAAIPTTLSAAEMTRIHRHATGVDPSTPRVRPAIVINDPAISTSQPPAELAASAANSLGHAVEGPATDAASPVPALAGGEAVRLIAAAYAGDPGAPDRDALALAALLSGYTIDQAGYGLHHVLSQTLVRVAGAGHGPANAAMLPHTLAALRERGRGVFAAAAADPDAARHAAAATGAASAAAPTDTAATGATAGANTATAADIDLDALAARLADLAGARRLRDIGVPEAKLEACVAAAAERAELRRTPPPAGAGEIRDLYRRAW